MSAPRPDPRFASESAWPFTLRRQRLEECIGFLAADTDAPRVLRVTGPSGAGKSFLVRELMTRLSVTGRNRVGLYLDTPPADLEGSALFERVAVQLSERRTSTRDAPTFIDGKTTRAWSAVANGRRSRAVSVLYALVRDVLTQFPLVGALLKIALPSAMAVKTPNGNSTAPIRFLMRRSRSQPVVVVLDNVQFLPFATREILAGELAGAGEHLRLVLIERVLGNGREDWMPPVPDAVVDDLELGGASLSEVEELAAEILPMTEDAHRVAAAIHRRSGGNLKSVWFQLRLVASRRGEQGGSPQSYEDVILALPALDQAVLRFVVFTVGGFTIANLAMLLHATDLHIDPERVGSAIADMAALGLLVVNGDTYDRVRVEHEIVAQVVDATTPEEEKLDLHNQTVAALSAVLESGVSPMDAPVLYDRLLGTVTGAELQASPALMTHVVRFVGLQSDFDRHAYLAGICRDSVCWDVLDLLPETTVRTLFDAIQKAALFEFGLVAAARLRRNGSGHVALASLYEAKYLVQLFRYDEARAALERAPLSKEARVVDFNIRLNLVEDERAAGIASQTLQEATSERGTEQDYVILRNAAHLFEPTQARHFVQTAVDGFESHGMRFAAATALNNLGIVELSAGSPARARQHFETARRRLADLDSAEVYEPLVNLSGLALRARDLRSARRLLEAARAAAPRSLQQDAVMLDVNEMALRLCEGEPVTADVSERLDVLAQAARKTRDLRFVAVTCWFADVVNEVAPVPSRRLGPSSVEVARLRASPNVALEFFVPVPTAAAGCAALTEVPFVLSPHWRY